MPNLSLELQWVLNYSPLNVNDPQLIKLFSNNMQTVFISHGNFMPKCSTPRFMNMYSGFANFIDEWSHCDFCFTNFGVILEYLESSITTKKAIFRPSSTWSWHVYTIVYTWKAQIHDGSHRVNFDRNLPPSCFVLQYNSLILMI